MKSSSVLASLVCSTFAVATTSHANILLESLNSQQLITFDADYPGVVSTGPAIVTTKLAEPDSFRVIGSSTDRANVLVTSGASLAYGFIQDGTPYRLRADQNNNGNTTEEVNFNPIGIYRPTDGNTTGFQADYGNLSSLSSNGYLLSGDGDFATGGLFLRAQNNTGGTVTDFKFDASVFYKEDDDNKSTFTWGYAIDNGDNISTMSFVDLGATPAITNGDTFAGGAKLLSVTVSTAGVADGEFLVLGFRDGGGGGSSIVLDDIGVTAVPEPSSLALIGLAGIACLARRRG